MESVQAQIKEEVTGKDGELVFPEDFIRLGSTQAVLMALSRLVKEKELVRLAKGIYLRPKNDPRLGMILPSIEQIAHAVAEKDHVRIRPTGAYALNKLGISTQVPVKVVFLTDGHPKSIKIGKGRLIFKMTSPKRLAAKNDTVFLVSQALQALKGNIEDNEPIYNKLLTALSQVPLDEIRSDARYAPQSVTRILLKMADKIAANDPVFTIKR
nr:DUF6088 family protein [uncultured Sediminibacterium sp.]